VAWPFFKYAGLPRATDAELHIFRIAELGYSLRAGNLYPRWAPDFYHGYGYPIFNYYAPFTYHLGNWITLLSPDRAAIGAKLLFILAHLLGASGAYLLGREFGGQGGGLLGSATFAFAPYIMVLNPHVRGDLAEVFALALVPWALWSWELLWQKGGKAAFVAAVASAAIVLLSHNLTGLTLMILLCAFSAWQWLALKRKARFKWGLLAGILVLMLTAYFWLPFLLERHFVQLDNVAGEGHYDYRNHFVMLQELFAFMRPVDWRATTTQAPLSVGAINIFLALVGIITSLLLRRGVRHVLFYGIATAICLWLMTPGSQLVWETVPGLTFYQFPWRFLGPLAALLIPLIASIGNVTLMRKFRMGLLTALFVLIIVFALPGLYPIPWQSGFGEINLLDYIDFENEGRWRGTTSTNDFVPTGVEMIPDSQETVLRSYAFPPVDRVNRYTLPEGTIVNIVEDVPWRNHFEIQTAEKFILRLYLFYFPGWRAYINGVEAPIDIAHPEGFITVSIPPGHHDVVLQFEDTVPRKIGWVIATVGSFIFLTALRVFPQKSNSKSEYTDSFAWRWFMLLLGVIVIFKVTVADFTEWFHYTSPLGETWAAEYSQTADFGGEIALLGFDVSHKQLRAGRSLDITLYWNAQHVLSETYQSFVHLVYPEGTIWTQSDHLNPAGFPTNLWPIDRYISDKHRLILPPDLPPGEYYLSVGLYTLKDGERLPILWADSGASGDNLILSETIMIRR